MVLHPVPFEHAYGTVIHPDRHCDGDGPLRKHEPIPEGRRDIDVIGQLHELVAGQLEGRVGICVLHNGHIKGATVISKAGRANRQWASPGNTYGRMGVWAYGRATEPNVA